MAAGDSKISICNIALIALGEGTITSLADNTKRAILCNARYDQVRRAVLESHPWNCAKRRAQLPAAAQAPVFGFQAAFPVPADFLRLVEIVGFEHPKWEIEDGQILCDYSAPLAIRYIYDLQDETRLMPTLVDCIGYALAAELAVPLCQSLSKQQDMLKQLAGKLDNAKLVNAQQNSSPELEDDVLLESRR
ncbi:MAG TPA: hypothetical protein VGV37_02500 [Aliidongia sp.]|uniref:hypothetical protein n=1 Tax=Aliidongia sp. TaxID=1914230 RepID=UPI002DDD6A17|nr:hypothetical protein [Aliidongia sp.]HEV2673381.1 hypothetical protein [Aliidongia sp.]